MVWNTTWLPGAATPSIGALPANGLSILGIVPRVPVGETEEIGKRPGYADRRGRECYTRG